MCFLKLKQPYCGISDFNRKTVNISWHGNSLPHKLDGKLEIADLLSLVTLSMISVQKLFSRPDLLKTGDLLNWSKIRRCRPAASSRQAQKIKNLKILQN